MFAIVGLGNPGSQYAQTRHNAGVWVLEELCRGIEKVDRIGLPPLQWQQNFSGRYSICQFAGKRCVLVLPQTYMNESGKAVSAVCRFFKIDVSELIVVHDELDFPAGVMRVKRGGTSGGHKGVQDIIRCMGGDDFCRIRVGIGHPSQVQTGQNVNNQSYSGDVSNWVLGRPDGTEKEIFERAVVEACAAIRALVEDGIEVAQQRFNKRAT